MPSDLCDEKGELICSQLTAAIRESKKRQSVGMRLPFPLYFFSAGSTHELAIVVTVSLHDASYHQILI
jgi:hypothetical protein